jgi:excisionase family DNA binding protein
MGAEEWLDAESAARYLGLKPATIYRLIVEGQLEGRRFPVRLRREDLDACLERCRIKPGQLAHLDGNAARRAHGDRTPPMPGKGVPDRRYGRRYAAAEAEIPPGHSLP